MAAPERPSDGEGVRSRCTVPDARGSAEGDLGGRWALLRAGRKSPSELGRPTETLTGPTAALRGVLGQSLGGKELFPGAWPSGAAGGFYQP